MADTEPTKDVTTSSAEIRWPDPTRPIISERDGAPSFGSPPDGQHEGSGEPDGGRDSGQDGRG